MHTSKSIAASKTKMRFFMPLLLVCTAYATNAFAQNKPAVVPLRPFGVVMGKTSTQLTYDEALANPMLICADTNYLVVSYEIAFLPKGGEFWGPAKQGAGKLTGKVLDGIKSYKTSGVELTRVFFDKIMLKSKSGKIIPDGTLSCDLTLK